ncbi:MAG: DUF4129 domain-containing protein [Planctomycetaceae bacterium]
MPEPLDADTIRRTVKEVLAGEDYQLAPAPPRSEAVTEWLTWLREQLIDPFTNWWEGISGQFAWADEVLSGAVVGLLAVLIVQIILARRRRNAAVPSAPGTEELVDRPAELHALALLQGEQGEHVVAVRLLIQSVKLQLENLEHRKNRPGLTNRELLRRYRQTRLAQPLARLVDAVDQGWFGNRHCSREDYLACLAAYDEIAAAASRSWKTVS